jgi:hypothetical protein
MDFKIKLTIICLIFSATIVFAQGTTYYSQNADPTVLANWNTNPDGGGSTPSSFANSGDIFILQSGQTVSILNDNTWTIATGVTLTINGTLELRRNNTNNINIDGIIVFSNATQSQITLQTGGGNAQHVINIRADATLRTNNVNGIHGVANASVALNQRITFNADQAASYVFNGGDQTTNGLPATLNSLTFEGTGTKTIANQLNRINSNFTLSGTVTTVLIGPLTVAGNLSIGSGTTLNPANNTLTIGGNFTRTDTGIFNAGTGTVVFLNPTSKTQQIISGETTFNNLTINSTGGVRSTDNLTVNGILNLESANPNVTDGSLDMVVDYESYSNVATPVGSLTNTYTQSHDILNSNILFMGPSATTIGQGDVTGKVKRTTIAANTEYTFGSQFTTITFSSAGTLPSAIMFVITKGSDRGNHANKTNTVARLYQVIRTGGEAPNAFSIKLRYLDTELNGNEENDLVLWDHHIPYNSSNTPHEHGKTSQNTTENWVALSGHGIGYLGTQEAIGGFTKYWMISKSLIPGNQWLGAVQNYWTKWDDPSNWSGGNIPTANDNVIIAPTTYSPVLPASATVGTLTIQPGATLNTSPGATLTIKGGIKNNGGIGSWNNFGTFEVGTTTVVFDFARGADEETSTLSGSTDFYNVSVTNGTFMVLQGGSTLNVKGELTNDGNLDASTFQNTVGYIGAGNQTIIDPNGGNSGYNNLLIGTEGTLTWPTSNDMKIAGNLTNNKPGLSIPGTIELSGVGSEQVMGGTYSTTFENLVVNSNAGVLLENGQTITGTLTLTSGVVTTGSNIVTAKGTISGGSASSHISGKLARLYTETGSKNFPVGKNENYRPVSINFSQLTGQSTVTVEQFEDEIPGAVEAVVPFAVRYWKASQTGGSDFEYSITLDGSGFSPIQTGTAVMLKGDGATISTQNVTIEGTNYTNASAYTSFSDFGLGEVFLVWTGVTSNEWVIRTNWSPSDNVPANGASVRIPEVVDGNYYPLIETDPNAPLTLSNLLIDADAKIEIAAGKALTITQDLVNNAGEEGILLLSDESGTASLLHNSTGTEATVERYISGNADLESMLYHTVSVPLTETSNPLSGLFLGSYLYDYKPDFEGNWFPYGPATTIPLSVQQGYLIFYPEPFIKYSFPGTLNNGDFPVTVRQIGTVSQTYSLVPNPYPSAIDWDLANKAFVDDAMWIWDPVAKNYATYGTDVGTLGATNQVPVGQAFFVRTSFPNESEPSLVFNNIMRIHGNQAFFKQKEQTRDVLRVRAKANTSEDEIVLRFRNDATHSFDNNTDAVKFFGMGGSPQLYTLSVDGQLLSIYSIPPVNDPISIPLGFEMDTNGPVSLLFGGAASFDPHISVFLSDKFENTIIDLRKTSQYNFLHNVNNSPDRFEILLNEAVSVQEINRQHPKLLAWFSNEVFHLIIPQDVTEPLNLELFSAHGQLVLKTVMQAGVFSLPVRGLSKGLYIVSVTAESHTLTTKAINH